MYHTEKPEGLHVRLGDNLRQRYIGCMVHSCRSPYSDEFAEKIGRASGGTFPAPYRFCGPGGPHSYTVDLGAEGLIHCPRLFVEEEIPATA